MFAEGNVDLIRSAILNELKSAQKKFGETHHSDHEGWSVLLEEYEEAKADLSIIKSKIDALWEQTKENDVGTKDLSYLIKMSVLLSLESTQIGAMACKWLYGKYKDMVSITLNGEIVNERPESE